MENKTNFCTNCGNPLNGEKFCPNCGKGTEKPTLQLPKLNTGDISNLLKRLEGRTIGISGAVLGVIFVLMLFSKWFIISLGNIGDLIYNSYGVSLDRSYSVATLLPGLIKLGKIAGESDALAWGFAFAFILVFAALFVIGYAVSAIKNAYNNTNNIEAVGGLSASAIWVSAIGIAGVWILKAIINYAMEESGVGAISSIATDVVAFTKTPVIMLIIGIAVKIFCNSQMKSYNFHLRDEYNLYSDDKLVVLSLSNGVSYKDISIINDILIDRTVDIDKKTKQYNYIWDLYSDKTDDELHDIVRTIYEDDLNKEIAREILNVRQQLDKN